MKKFKTVQIKLCHTGSPLKAGQLFIHPNKLLCIAQSNEDRVSNNKAVEIFALSDDPLKYGDKAYNLHTGQIHTITRFTKLTFIEIKSCKKIVATTDKNVTPIFWIRDNIKKIYADSFNDGKPITEIDLEIVPIMSTSGSTKEELNNNEEVVRYDLKTREDGSVILRPTRMFSLSEVLNLTFGAAMAGYANGSIKIDDIQGIIKEWQDENVQ